MDTNKLNLHNTYPEARAENAVSSSLQSKLFEKSLEGCTLFVMKRDLIKKIMIIIL